MLAELSMTKPSNVTENDVLYHRIKGGDRAAIDEMIERNIPLVKSRVGNFLKSYRRFDHLQDDLVGEGFLTLTKVVNSFVDTVTDKPTGRIIFELDKTLGGYVDSEIGAGMMSDRTLRRRRSDGVFAIPKKVPLNVNSPPANLWTRADGRVIRKQIVEENVGLYREGMGNEVGNKLSIDNQSKLGTTDARELIESFSQHDSTPEYELLDTILACCECEEDQMIVNLRIKGYVDAEIGEQLNISRRTVCMRREEIEKRFNERMAS